MNVIDIRTVEQSELPQAFAVLCELRSHLDFKAFLERLQRQAEHGYCLFGAYDQAALIGLVGMRPVETMARGKHLHIDDLVVTASRRREGVGTALLTFAEHYATTAGLGLAFLDSRDDVIGFYKSLGYSPHTATLMRKRLQ